VREVIACTIRPDGSFVGHAGVDPWRGAGRNSRRSGRRRVREVMTCLDGDLGPCSWVEYRPGSPVINIMFEFSFSARRSSVLLVLVVVGFRFGPSFFGFGAAVAYSVGILSSAEHRLGSLVCVLIFGLCCRDFYKEHC